MAYQTILVETRGHVGLITLNRPKAMNALNSELIAELGRAIDGFEADQRIGSLILTGSEKAFAAGADIKEMAPLNFVDAFIADYAEALDRVARARKPIVGAVAGYCLGGGCELAMMCDLIIAADTAKFGQPEINLGITPGFGGTQRLPRNVGEGWAKYLVLSGRVIRADEALRIGLIQAVFPKAELMTQAMKLAEELAGKSPLAMRYCKAAVNAAADTDLATGQRIERDLFALAFASEDQTEGMRAFLEKRAPEFGGR